MIRLVVIIIWTVIFPMSVYGQKFMNLDFEVAEIGTHEPYDWFVANEFDGTVKLDSSIAHHGKYGLLILPSKKNFNSEVLLLKTLPYSLFQSKGNIKIKAFFKKFERASPIKILCKQFTDDYSPIKQDSTNTYHKSAKGWMEASLNALLVPSAKYVVIGIVAEISKPLWIDDFKLKFDGEEMKEELFPIDTPSKDEIKALNQLIIPVYSSGFTLTNSLKYFLNRKTSAQILGLGEITHGLKEVYRMKVVIAEYLLSEGGYQVLAMEMDHYDALKLDSGIKSKTADLNNILSQTGYWPWKTKEFLSLLEWMRTYNASHIRKLDIVGIDLPVVPTPIQVLQVFAKKYDERIALLTDSVKAIYNSGLKDQEISNLNKHMNGLTQYLFANEKSFKSLTRHEFSLLTDAVRFIRQYQLCFQNIGSTFGTRDSCMAENLSIQMGNNLNKKVILWAHNFHVQKKQESILNYLRPPRSIYTIGFSIGTGTYNAVESNSLIIDTLRKPVWDSYEFLFTLSEENNWLLDLSDIKYKIPWLAKKRLFRFTGSEHFRYQFSESDLLENFDSIIFIKKSTESNLLFGNTTKPYNEK